MGFKWTEVRNLLLTREVLTSRKAIWELDMVEGKEREDEELRAAIKLLRESLPCVHRRNMSSINLSQRRGFYGYWERKICSKGPR